MVLAFIEHSINAIRFYSGRYDLKTPNINSLLLEVFKTGLLSRTDYDALQITRKTTNALKHSCPPDHSDRMEWKSFHRYEKSGYFN